MAQLACMGVDFQFVPAVEKLLPDIRLKLRDGKSAVKAAPCPVYRP